MVSTHVSQNNPRSDLDFGVYALDGLASVKTQFGHGHAWTIFRHWTHVDAWTTYGFSAWQDTNFGHGHAWTLIWTVTLDKFRHRTPLDSSRTT